MSGCFLVQLVLFIGIYRCCLEPLSHSVRLLLLPGLQGPNPVGQQPQVQHPYSRHSSASRGTPMGSETALMVVPLLTDMCPSGHSRVIHTLQASSVGGLLEHVSACKKQGSPHGPHLAPSCLQTRASEIPLQEQSREPASCLQDNSQGMFADAEWGSPWGFLLCACRHAL